MFRGWMRLMSEKRWRCVVESRSKYDVEVKLPKIVADKKTVVPANEVVSSLILAERDETPTAGGWLKGKHG